MEKILRKKLKIAYNNFIEKLKISNPTRVDEIIELLQGPPLLAFRRNKNLGDLIMRSDFRKYL